MIQRYNGDAHDFEAALRGLARQCDEESRERPEGEDPDAPYGERLDTLLSSLRDKAERYRRQYVARVRSAVQALAREWRDSPDEDVRRFGEALESGDYSELVI